MGKAAREKNKHKHSTPEERHAAGLCMNCGKRPAPLWCRFCVERAKANGRAKPVPRGVKIGKVAVTTDMTDAIADEIQRLFDEERYL
jgi:hypothetical protein